MKVRSLIPAGYHITYQKGRSKLATLANIYSHIVGKKETIYLFASDFAIPLLDLQHIKKLENYLE